MTASHPAAAWRWNSRACRIEEKKDETKVKRLITLDPGFSNVHASCTPSILNQSGMPGLAPVRTTASREAKTKGRVPFPETLLILFVKGAD